MHNVKFISEMALMTLDRLCVLMTCIKDIQLLSGEVNDLVESVKNQFKKGSRHVKARRQK